jgi:enoyl-CoA hydratase/3-hydroxyacyl-CoA dehydrogenase
MKMVETVGVVGAGTMGAALAQKFAQENFKVILADREMQFVEKGLSNIKKMLTEGIERKVFTEDQVMAYLANIKGSANLVDLKECDLIVEAIFENFDAKKELFSNLCTIVKPDTVLATNTSSYSVNDLANYISYPQRFLGLHYFYHAAKNRLVEIIPGNHTSKDSLDLAKRFCIQSGKDAIFCRDSYGFVVNRFFVPWLNESVRLLKEGIANTATIDDVCMQAFGIGMGPFALMNATGVPVAYHAQKTLEVYGNFYNVSNRLKQQVEDKKDWDLTGDINADETIRKLIADRILGVVYLVCSQLLDEKVCMAVDINRGARIGLKWRKGPIEMMQQTGAEKVKILIESITTKYNLIMPTSIGDKHWKMSYVKLDLIKKNALITIDRPEDLNALNEEVIKELDEKFTIAEEHRGIENIFIMGAGKAFVAGADIKFFVKNIKQNKINDIETFTAFGQKVFQKIDLSSKKVIAIINGLALGGGLELALCADTILALPKAQVAFPETGIGIYPGLGGTQRTGKKVGIALAKYLVLMGKMLSSKDATEIGLVDKIVDLKEMFGIINGNMVLPENTGKVLNPKWQQIEHFFEINTLNDILSKNYQTNGMKTEDAEKIHKTLQFKAPIALRIANQLIEEARGCKSELDHLNEIFTTSDALLGLTSIGKQVTYSGN